MTPVCRYGQTWADWRKVGPGYTVVRVVRDNYQKGRTERLTLEEGEWVTALTGQSGDSNGWTLYLDVTTSTGRRWQQGLQQEEDSGFSFSLRPSPALGGRLSHLSGRETYRDMVLCCHWTCYGGEGRTVDGSL